MFSNLRTVCLWAGYGVSQGIFQLRVKCEVAVWGSQFPRWTVAHQRLRFSDLFSTQQFLECIFHCLCVVYAEKHTKNYTYLRIIYTEININKLTAALTFQY